jgi:hypothetical protein
MYVLDPAKLSSAKNAAIGDPVSVGDAAFGVPRFPI